MATPDLATPKSGDSGSATLLSQDLHIQHVHILLVRRSCSQWPITAVRDMKSTALLELLQQLNMQNKHTVYTNLEK